MKYIRATLILCAILYFFESSNYAAGIGELMGGLVTVVPEGPFDSKRNPALLFFLPKDFAIGYEMSISADSSDDVSGNIAANFSGLTMDKTEFLFEDLDSMYVKGTLTYASKIGSTSIIGIAAHSNVTYQTPDMQLSLFISQPFSVTISSHQKTEQIENENDIYLSFATRLHQNLTAGISLSIQKKYRSERNYSATFQMANFNAAGGKIDESQEYNGMALIGLLYHSDLFQTGIIITSGKYGWQRNSLSENESNITQPTKSYDVYGSTSYHSRYGEGPSTIAGIQYKITPILSFGLEAGYQFPIDYNDKVISRVDDTIEEINSKNEITKVFVAGGGISCVLLPSITIGAGLRYQTFTRTAKMTNSEQHQRQNFKMQWYTIIGGIDITIRETIHAIFFVTGDIITTNIEFATENTNRTMAMDLELTSTVYSCGLGIAHYF